MRLGSRSSPTISPKQAWWFLAIAVASFGSPPLRADELVEEIVVTARRLPERLVDVPLSIDAFTREDIDTKGIDSLQAMIARSPGLYFESAWGGLYAAPTLRGQQPSPAGDINVGVFVDGIYQANEAAVDPGTLDFERIEVARGPQNTLFGHSAFAGAIHYVSATPTEAGQSGFGLEAGSDNYQAAKGYLSGPLLGDSVLGRLALGTASFDGTHHNSALPGTSLGGWKRSAASISLATPDDKDFRASLSVRVNRTKSMQPAASEVTFVDYNCGNIEAASGAWSYFCGAMPLASTFDISPDIPDSDSDVLQSALVLSLPLGGGQVESQTTFYRGTADAIRDFDMSSTGGLFGVCTFNINCFGPPGIPQFVNRFSVANEVFRNLSTVTERSQEIRWHATSGEKFQWMIGAVTWWTDKTSEARLGVARGDLAPDERLTALLPGDPLLVGPVSLVNSAIVDNPNSMQMTQALDVESRRTIALFGTVDYKLTNTIRARAELRVSHERRELENRVANYSPGFGNSIAPRNFNDMTPRFTLHFAPISSWSGYVSAAKGSQSGGINPYPGLAPDEQVFDPEYNWTYEISGRYRSDAGAFGIQATAYYIDWRNAQTLGFADTPGINNLITLNTTGLHIRGLELSMDARVLSALRAELDFSWTDPEYSAGSDDPGSRRFCGITGGNRTSSFCTIGPARSGSRAGVSLVPYIDGNVPGRTPREMWHAALVFEPPVRGDGNLVFRIDANGQDDVFDRAINGARFGKRRLLDANLSYSIGNWSISLWGRNLEDVQYIRALASRGQVYFPTSPRPLDELYGNGRRIGLSVNFSSKSGIR